MTGTWMHDAAASWYMTSLAPSPAMVALVQTAMLLPTFFLSLPAGALADIIDRRRYLMFAQSWIILSALTLGVLTLSGVTTAGLLLLLTFSIGIGSALSMPAYAATLPDLVPREELLPALTLNGIATNATRAVGPALGGLLIGLIGPGGIFLLNSMTFLVMLNVIRKLPRAKKESTLPSERLLGAVRLGLRFARQTTILKRVLIRSGAFFFSAVPVIALMPIIARQELHGTALTYGLMLSAFGIGAVLSALMITRLAARLARDRIFEIGVLIFAADMLAIAHIRSFALLLPLMMIAGVAWLMTLSCLQIAAQTCLPAWVRARGLAVYLMMIMGSMAAGSAFWGMVARASSVTTSLTIAAGMILLGLLLFRRMSLETAGLDLSPVDPGEFPANVLPIDDEHGPVQVTIDYRVTAENWDNFLAMMPRLRQMRRRNGAYSWSVFQNVAEPERFTETFFDESWLEHLRHHRRLTVADENIQLAVYAFHAGDTPPKITHAVSRKLPRP